MEINGIPLHPLVVHAVVVLTPTAGLLAILYGLVPRWRWLTRWPFLFAGVVGAGVTYFAKITGQDLKDSRNLGGRIGDLIETHEMWANRLMLSMWLMAAVAIIGWWVMPFRSPLENRPDREARAAVLVKPLVVVLPLVGILVIVLAFLTGDAGAKAVWT
jgi:hypothetical protein